MAPDRCSPGRRERRACRGRVLPLVFAVMEESKTLSFCGSCHLVAPLERSVQSNDGSLAAIHYGRGLVPHNEPCYTCHLGTYFVRRLRQGASRFSGTVNQPPSS